MIFHVPLNSCVLVLSLSTITYEYYLTPLTELVIIYAVKFNTGSLYLLPTKYIYVFNIHIKRKFAVICIQK